MAGTAIGLQVGVAKEAEVVAVRILDCTGSGTISDTVAGLDWVAGGWLPRGAPTALGMALGACVVVATPHKPCPGGSHTPAGCVSAVFEWDMRLRECIPQLSVSPTSPARAANHKNPAVVTLSLGIQVRARRARQPQPAVPTAPSAVHRLPQWPRPHAFARQRLPHRPLSCPPYRWAPGRGCWRMLCARW